MTQHPAADTQASVTNKTGSGKNSSLSSPALKPAHTIQPISDPSPSNGAPASSPVSNSDGQAPSGKPAVQAPQPNAAPSSAVQSSAPATISKDSIVNTVTQPVTKTLTNLLPK